MRISTFFGESILEWGPGDGMLWETLSYDPSLERYLERKQAEYTTKTKEKAKKQSRPKKKSKKETTRRR